MLEELKASKEYRQAFIEEAIRSRISAQINALRKERGWGLKAFAGEISKKVSWAYRLEDPNAAIPTVPSLLEVAEAFDVALDVRFCTFSEILDDVTTLGPESFKVPSFCEELKGGAFKPRKRNSRKGMRLIHGRKLSRLSRHSKDARQHSETSNERKPTAMEPLSPNIGQLAQMNTNRIGTR